MCTLKSAEQGVQLGTGNAFPNSGINTWADCASKPDATAHLVAHVQHGSHGVLDVGAVLLLQDVLKAWWAGWQCNR